MRGHFLFPTAEKESKNAAGGPPDPRLLADFLFMKIDSNAATRTGPNKKGAAAPRLGVAAFFQPRAQPVPGGLGPPCSMSVGSRKKRDCRFS